MINLLFKKKQTTTIKYLL